MGMCTDITWLTWRWRVQLVILITPLLLSPLPLVIGDAASIAAYLLLLMGTYWCTNIIPLGVTGLLPIFYLPMTGLLSLADTCVCYLESSTMMLVGSMMVAICVETSNLHRRIALWILCRVGAKPQWLMFGFMLPTFILSMFINNTSTTAMMMPIMEAVLTELDPKTKPKVIDTLEILVEKEHDNLGFTLDENHNETILDGEGSTRHESNSVDVNVVKELPTDFEIVETEYDAKIHMNGVKFVGCDQKYSQSSSSSYSGDGMFDMELKAKSFELDLAMVEEGDENDLISGVTFVNFAKAMTLSVCYSANVGGTATLTGTNPNTIMKGFVDDIWASHGINNSPVNYATWLVYGLPIAFICFFIVWGWLILFYFGFRALGCCCPKAGNEEREEAVTNTIRQQYALLGSIRFEEVMACSMFIALILLWFFRSPGFMPGWGDYFKEGYVGDAVPAVMIGFCLFFLPADIPQLRVNGEGKKKPIRVLLEWPAVHSKFPWSIMFLMGGGYALANASKVSGLSEWIGEQMTALAVLPSLWMVYFLCIVFMLLTSIMSNSATCTILVPIMASMAESLGMNPLYLMFPVAISCSKAFMLPVATPPNAIAYSYGRINVMDMVKAGSALNLACALVITIATETWAYKFLDFGEIQWDEEYINLTTTEIICITPPPVTTLPFHREF